MKIRRTKTLATEIFKTVNKLNPNFMKTIFTFKTNSRVRPFDLLVKNRNTEEYGSKSLIALGPKIWNALLKNKNKKGNILYQIQRIYQIVVRSDLQVENAPKYLKIIEIH